MYAPRDLPEVNQIVEYISEATNIPIVQFSTNITDMPSGSIIACDNYDQIINWMWTEQNVTQAGRNFIINFYVGILTVNYNAHFVL